MMDATVPQRPLPPVVATDFAQVMKLTEGVTPTHMGMLGFSGMPKTPPKRVPPRHTADGGISPDTRPGKLQGRLRQ